MTASQQTPIGQHRDLDRWPDIRDRLVAGQMFNSYGMTNGKACVGLGPVTNCLVLAVTHDDATADFLAEALRAATGQPPAAATLTGRV